MSKTGSNAPQGASVGKISFLTNVSNSPNTWALKGKASNCRGWLRFQSMRLLPSVVAEVLPIDRPALSRIRSNRCITRRTTF